jgi:hypothetical protein
MLTVGTVFELAVGVEKVATLLRTLSVLTRLHHHLQLDTLVGSAMYILIHHLYLKYRCCLIIAAAFAADDVVVALGNRYDSVRVLIVGCVMYRFCSYYSENIIIIGGLCLLRNLFQGLNLYFNHLLWHTWNHTHDLVQWAYVHDPFDGISSNNYTCLVI